MTNAIEQAKREMYQRIANMRGRHFTGNDGDQYHVHGSMITAMEDSMESYLELLRQDHEALHHTARARFEDTRKLEAANQELIEKLSLMTTDRDSLRNRMQAKEAREASASTSGQTSGDRVSCETPDAKTMALLGAVVDVQRTVNDWGLGDLKAKKAMRIVAKSVNNIEVWQAMKDFEKPTTCMHSFFAIGNDPSRCIYCGEIA